MQYFIRQVYGSAIPTFGGAKAFETTSDVVNYLQKMNKDKRLFVAGVIEANAEVIQVCLKERLSIVSVVAERGEGIKWFIAAF